jgi:hypothetical protein
MEAAVTVESPDRRAGARAAGEAHGIVSARVRPGHVVQVIDVASGGVLVEGGKGLRPGAAIDFQIETVRQRATLRGRVLRCVVSRLQPNAVCYRTAIALDGGMPPLLGEDGGRGMSFPCESPGDAGGGVAATHSTS